MKPILTLLICVLCSASAAALLGKLAHTAYDRGVINIDVGDRHGHGPDRGKEWDTAAHHKINRYSLLSGVVLLGVLTIAARGFRVPSAKGST